ncbi:zf-TFIIB domain-containing protein [Algiphilus sp.]|uniref:TFIIB-type zinc ribbon-containing protein n=1 Tax=Algiphilus sp. TaxID=1872431 RepID=UPI003C60235D
MDHKDRFGDTLRRREQADENRFFAALEQHRREESQRGRDRVDGAGLAAQAEPAEGHCPRCGVTLAPARVGALDVHQCQHCGRVWLDRAAHRPFPGSDFRGCMYYLEALFRAR